MENRMVNGSWVLLESLYRLGIDTVFGYPGGTVIPIYGEIYKYKKIKHYFSRHEQGSAHEADGFARATGKIGVCLATSGPGATNLVTGIMTAHMDSVPLLAITGQVGTSSLGKDSFQESDIVGITLPITKTNYLVTDIRDLPRIIKEAYFIATTGRPGPVLVDIPKDVQNSEISFKEFESLHSVAIKLPGYEPTYHGHPRQIKKALDAIRNAKRPLIIAGAGILKAGAAKMLLEIAERTNIPVTTTLLGLGVFPSNHELSLGMIGMHGTVASNYATEEADLVIAAGIRFDDRITGDPEKFCKNAKIIHIDIDPAEIGKNKLINIPIVGDLRNVLFEFNKRLDQMEHKDWVETVKGWKKEYPISYGESKEGRLMPQEVLSKLDKILNGNAIVVSDVGQHQMWTAQYISFNKPNSFLTSGGSGTMGYGLPAAIGAQIGRPEEKVVAIVGDGGFQMTFQELMLIKQYNLPIKIVIINNSYLGMVRQWQEIFNEKRYSFVDLSINPDFNKIAEAYGINSMTIDTKEKLENELRPALESDGAIVINCIVEKEANVLPMIPAGTSVSEMVGKRGVIENE